MLVAPSTALSNLTFVCAINVTFYIFFFLNFVG